MDREHILEAALSTLSTVALNLSGLCVGTDITEDAGRMIDAILNDINDALAIDHGDAFDAMTTREAQEAAYAALEAWQAEREVTHQ